LGNQVLNLASVLQKQTVSSLCACLHQIAEVASFKNKNKAERNYWK